MIKLFIMAKKRERSIEVVRLLTILAGITVVVNGVGVTDYINSRKTRHGGRSEVLR